jgi:hypothetical protein
MDGGLTLLFVAVILVGVALLVVIAVTRRPGKRLNQDKYREKWLRITNEMDNANQSSLAIGLLNADRLLDEALRERGIAGETLGERMKNAKALFSDRQGVWDAHKLRNRIAHEELKVTSRNAHSAMHKFKIALKDIGAL